MSRRTEKRERRERKEGEEVRKKKGKRRKETEEEATHGRRMTPLELETAPSFVIFFLEPWSKPNVDLPPQGISV